MTGYVYAVECAGRVKIGYSEDPKSRFANINAGAPFPCALLGYWRGGGGDEYAVHERFSDIRVHGEWFAKTVSLVSFIELSVSGLAPVLAKSERHQPVIEIVKKAAERAGGVTSLAKALGVRHTSFYSWRRVPAERVRAIEAATDIPAHELRPDIFPLPRGPRPEV